MSSNDRIAEMVRLLEWDYDQTSDFIRSVVGSTSIARGWGVTAWLTVLGVGVQQESWLLALLAATAVFPFALLDAYYSWLYGQALRHGRAIEQLISRYYRAVESGDDDPELIADFEVAAAVHRFGLYSHFRRFSIPELKASRPNVVFHWFYPALVLVALVVAAVIAA